jgi:hypothetical protein
VQRRDHQSRPAREVLGLVQALPLAVRVVRYAEIKTRGLGGRLV